MQGSKQIERAVSTRTKNQERVERARYFKEASRKEDKARAQARNLRRNCHA